MQVEGNISSWLLFQARHFLDRLPLDISGISDSRLPRYHSQSATILQTLQGLPLLQNPIQAPCVALEGLPTSLPPSSPPSLSSFLLSFLPRILYASTTWPHQNITFGPETVKPACLQTDKTMTPDTLWLPSITTQRSIGHLPHPGKMS